MGKSQFEIEKCPARLLELPSQLSTVSCSLSDTFDFSPQCFGDRFTCPDIMILPKDRTWETNGDLSPPWPVVSESGS